MNLNKIEFPDNTHYNFIDGLRGISVLLVLMLHAHFQLGKGGAIGVQIFFVLSGFLITNKLVVEKKRTGSISLRKFWLSRIFRIFPSYFFLLFFVSFYSFIYANPIDMSKYLLEIRDSSLFISNLNWLWNNDLNSKFLGHTWSLSVEQQFYLFWPILFLITFNYFQSSLNIFIFFIFSFFLQIVFHYYFKSDFLKSVFHPALFYGCSLSLYFNNKSFKPNSFFIPSILILTFIIIFGIFKFTFDFILPDNDLFFIVLPVLIPIVLIHCISNNSSIITKFLSFRLFTFIGKMSFSLYLWHLPIFRLFKIHSSFSPSISFFLKIFISFIVSYFLYVTIEVRFLKYLKIKYIPIDKF